MMGSLKLYEKMYWNTYVGFALHKEEAQFETLLAVAEIIDDFHESNAVMEVLK